MKQKGSKAYDYTPVKPGPYKWRSRDPQLKVVAADEKDLDLYALHLRTLFVTYDRTLVPHIGEKVVVTEGFEDGKTGRVVVEGEVLWAMQLKMLKKGGWQAKLASCSEKCQKKYSEWWGEDLLLKDQGYGLRRFLRNFCEHSWDALDVKAPASNTVKVFGFEPQWAADWPPRRMSKRDGGIYKDVPVIMRYVISQDISHVYEAVAAETIYDWGRRFTDAHVDGRVQKWLADKHNKEALAYHIEQNINKLQF